MGHMGRNVIMNALLLNREGFQMPGDGWYQLAPLGEFPHAGARDSEKPPAVRLIPPGGMKTEGKRREHRSVPRFTSARVRAETEGTFTA